MILLHRKEDRVRKIREKGGGYFIEIERDEREGEGQRGYFTI